MKYFEVIAKLLVLAHDDIVLLFNRRFIEPRERLDYRSHAALVPFQRHSAASLAPALFLGLPPAFFNTGARNFPV